MTINKVQDGSSIVFSLEGRLDTTTAPMLENEVKNSLEGITDLTLDFNALEYISSAGLRVILAAQKIMNKQGSMKIVGVSSDIMEVFDITGFSDILTIE